MLQTGLYDLHVALQGRMVAFSGWSMPVQYAAGPIKEHMAVRRAGGLFDVSHMARLELRGTGVADFLLRVLTRSVARRKPGDAVYSLMTYSDGTVIDDLIAVRQEEGWLLVANAVNRHKDLEWLRRQANGQDVDIVDVTEQTSMLAVQGPDAVRLVSHVLGIDAGSLRRFKARITTWEAKSVLITRTGYTGEDGFELVLPRTEGGSLFQHLLETGRPRGWLPCGLAARDSLRLEACLPLYGHEISQDINPVEADLAWAVSFRNPRFIGRDALLKAWLEPPTRRLCAFRMEDQGVPRAGYAVYDQERRIGTVTSGNKSPTLDQFIGMALCDASATEMERFMVDIRGRRLSAVVVPKPFYSRPA